MPSNPLIFLLERVKGILVISLEGIRRSRNINAPF